MSSERPVRLKGKSLFSCILADFQMMKHTILTALLLLVLSFPAFAQEGVGYIPGMPVPQASAPSGDASAGSGSGDASDAKISKVEKASGQFGNIQTNAPEEEPVPQAGYKGVTPPSRLEPENKSTFTKSSGNQLSWIGFIPDENAHRIFIQTSQPTTFERLASSADRVEILIANTKLAVHNNNRELDMSYFKTPFAKAQAVASGTGVKVVVQLKSETQCDIQQHDNMIDIIARK